MRWHGGGRSSVFTRHKVNPAHSTGKPLPLLKELIGLFSDPGDTVLDPFAGSLSTAVAAKVMGRKAICVERDEENCRLGIERLRQEAMAL